MLERAQSYRMPADASATFKLVISMKEMYTITYSYFVPIQQRLLLPPVWGSDAAASFLPCQ